MYFRLGGFFALSLLVVLVSCRCPKYRGKASTVSPIVLVISAPSGCGKDTAVNALVQKNPDLFKIVSVTTRKMRVGEKNHFDYHFVDRNEFERMSKDGELLQEALVYGEKRGTLKSEFEKATAEGHNVIFNTDPKGFKDIKKALSGKANVVGIFILPPSKQVLRDRLVLRGTEEPKDIEYRMKLVDKAMVGFEDYDYKILSGTSEQVLAQIESIYNTLKIQSYDDAMLKHGRKLVF